MEQTVREQICLIEPVCLALESRGCYLIRTLHFTCKATGAGGAKQLASGHAAGQQPSRPATQQAQDRGHRQDLTCPHTPHICSMFSRYLIHLGLLKSQCSEPKACVSAISNFLFLSSYFQVAYLIFQLSLNSCSQYEPRAYWVSGPVLGPEHTEQ